MEPIRIMVNGMPGNMAITVAKHADNDDRFSVIPCSLTGPDISETDCMVDKTAFRLIRPDERDTAIETILERDTPFISVDYTHPTAVNGNAVFYTGHGLPFVMGTTGGDRHRLMETVAASPISAVISPNMAKQIVGFQAMMEHAAGTFKGLFEGYRIDITESHQHGKADTSGTAKAMIGHFNDLGMPVYETDIVMIRDPGVQKTELGVPDEHVKGHAWHTYTLKSEDGTVLFQFTHNVNGRDIYAKGTLDAVAFLAKKVNEGIQGNVYTMIDVLKGG